MNDNNLANHDVLFQRFIGAMAVVMVLFGAATLIAILSSVDQVIVLRMVSVFAAMFSGLLGLGSGYLLGKSR